MTTRRATAGGGGFDGGRALDGVLLIRPHAAGGPVASFQGANGGERALQCPPPPLLLTWAVRRGMVGGGAWLHLGLTAGAAGNPASTTRAFACRFCSARRRQATQPRGAAPEKRRRPCFMQEGCHERATLPSPTITPNKHAFSAPACPWCFKPRATERPFTTHRTAFYDHSHPR